MTLNDVMQKFKAGEIDQKEALQQVGRLLHDARSSEKTKYQKAIDEILGMDSEPGDNGDRKFGRAWERSQRGR